MTAPATGQPTPTDSTDEDDSFSWTRLVVSLVVIALVLGGVYYAYTAYQDSKTAYVGDCVTDADSFADSSSNVGRRGRGFGGSFGPETVDCSDPSARYVVLADHPSYTGPPPEGALECIDHDGAVAEALTDRPDHRTLCLGEVGADTSLSANTISEGECMIPAGEVPRRADCSAPGAMRVLAVLDVSTSFSRAGAGRVRECEEAGVPDADDGYSWGLAGRDHQRAVCLAAVGPS